MRISEVHVPDCELRNPLSTMYVNNPNRMAEYTARCFDDSQEELAPWPADDQVPDTLPAVLDYLQASYYQSAPANIAAGLAGDKYYEYDCGFGTTRARTQKRLNLARLHVQDELRRAGAADNAATQVLFAGRGILEHYLK